ncbi:LrgB family protein [Brevibacillus aydinogluensis]|uniref:LrgB family protein n=1 Tax=Brevibacillus TaxID=55080 RepID=UPI000E3AC429|nr:LrgB family protein [Brevibacillus aydinogluensis]MDT3416437.1 putative effector of murein hydrolase [Brevibacillus aydinogluensis]NNV02321.1 LrgB family protein [Brevibacillus sp. MCWH]REK66830.1 MAG: LrgB family protein [Brevibacillus sp.]UFJ62760.1 LrgB family protein [Anoxybacillus sediminis]
MIAWSVCSLPLTVLFYWLSKRINRRRPGLLFSPAVLTPAAVIGVLAVSGLPYEVYIENASILHEMLGVVTVAFAVPLYRNWPILAANWQIIILSLAAGSLVSIIAGVSTTMLVGLGETAAISVIPRSVTMPIAVGLSQAIGGVPSLTAVFCMLTSYAGVFMAPVIIKRCALNRPESIGLMYGMGAHVLGMVKAFERGDLAGSSSTLAVIAGALISVVWVFLLLPAIQMWLA